MQVAEIWRYPVKSLRGEQLDEARIGVEGVEGDRRYAIFDLTTGYGRTARRAPELLFAAARMRSDDSVEITLAGRIDRSRRLGAVALGCRRVTMTQRVSRLPTSSLASPRVIRFRPGRANVGPL